jgi:hypothetical protein
MEEIAHLKGGLIWMSTLVFSVIPYIHSMESVSLTCRQWLTTISLSGGDIVWARVAGYSWSPAQRSYRSGIEMICRDLEYAKIFNDLSERAEGREKIQRHVRFFGDDNTIDVSNRANSSTVMPFKARAKDVRSPGLSKVLFAARLAITIPVSIALKEQEFFFESLRYSFSI